MASKRGKNPSEHTIRMLCANAAGNCEYPGCKRRLFFDSVSAKHFNDAYIGHIIASSPDGPRGDPVLSYELSDKLDNLLLLCGTHHHLIDTRKEDYPVELLREFKQRHENKIQQICSLVDAQQTRVILFSAPIHGTVPRITTAMVNEAVMPERVISEEYPIELKTECMNFHENDVRHWQMQAESLTRQFQERVSTFFDHNPDMLCDLFGIGPIPLLAKLGELCGDKNSIRLHHHARHPETWKWMCSERNISFTTQQINIADAKGKEKVALIISLTAKIEADFAKQFLPGISSLYLIDSNDYSVDCIRSEKDLSEFWHKYLETLDDIHRTFPWCFEVPVIAAVPAVAAIEIGRRRMKGVHPSLAMYNAFENGYINTSIKIGD